MDDDEDDDDEMSRTGTPEPVKAFTPYKASPAASATSPPGALTSSLPKDLASRDAFTSPRTSGRSSGAGAGASGGRVRRRMGSDDDDDDEDDSDLDADQSDKLTGKQQIGLFEDAISLEQVRWPRGWKGGVS